MHVNHFDADDLATGRFDVPHSNEDILRSRLEFWVVMHGDVAQLARSRLSRRRFPCLDASFFCALRRRGARQLVSSQVAGCFRVNSSGLH